MIKVIYGYKDNKYYYLKTKGHAEYEDNGKDLVCAACSAIIIGFMNALDELNNDEVKIKQLTNEIEIIINTDDSLIQNYFELVMMQLKTIEESYSQFIKIERK